MKTNFQIAEEIMLIVFDDDGSVRTDIGLSHLSKYVKKVRKSAFRRGQNHCTCKRPMPDKILSK